MMTQVFSATTFGLDIKPIVVEIDTTFGKPSLIIIGMPTNSAIEAKERLTTALTNCGVRIKPKRTIINLAPADTKKIGSSFDLAMAVALLKLYGKIFRDTDDTIFFGELALDGSIRAVAGALPLVLAAKKLGYTKVVFPEENKKEVETVENIKLFPLRHLRQLITFYSADSESPLCPLKPLQFPNLLSQQNVQPTYTSIRDQHLAKKAIVLAAAGGHNILLIGPPGSGKTMTAQALIDLLPALSQAESLEATSIHSLRGMASAGLLQRRPFRQVHHTISKAGLLGGGSVIKPGEISLAHHGVLFLDEFPEFARDCIESLRQPLESGTVSISRAQGTVVFPANFTLIATANPCPCGFYLSQQKACRCSQSTREQYYKKLSGPILDRIDLHVPVESVQISQLKVDTTQDQKQLSELKQVQEDILKARQFQLDRYQEVGVQTTSQLTSSQVKTFIRVERTAETLLQRAANRMKLSARSYFKLLKISQTLADLDSADLVQKTHISQALQFRTLTI